MNADVVIVGAGPAGIFTALEMLKKGSRQKIVMVENQQVRELQALLPHHHGLLRRGGLL